jgi:hypothetical protein
MGTKKNVKIHKTNSNIQHSVTNKQKRKNNKSYIKKKINKKIATKKHKYYYGGDKTIKKYKSSSNKEMQLIFMDKPFFIKRDLQLFFKTLSPNYFIKNYPTEWEQIENLGLFSKKKSLIKNGLNTLEKGVYYLNYVYHYQKRVRSILYKIEDLIKQRIKLIFNTIVTEEELLEQNKGIFDDSPIESKPISIPQKGGEPPMNPYHILTYGNSQGIVGPSNSDFEENDEKMNLFSKIKSNLKSLFSKYKKRFFYKFDYKKAFKGVNLRYETDRLYFEIAGLYKKLKNSISHLASSQNKLYIYYLMSVYFNDVILDKLKVSANDARVVESLETNLLKEYKKKQALIPIIKAINEYVTKFKQDYKEIVYMYDQSISGFWIQDEYGRIVVNLYKSQDDDIATSKQLADFIKNFNIKEHLQQIVSNIMGQIYLKISKTDLQFVNKQQPPQTYFEVKMIAQERYCFSRIMVQYFIWDYLLQSQGFKIDIDLMLSDPTNTNIIQIIPGDPKSQNTSLIDKMISADSNLVYTDDKFNKDNNRVEWEASEEGLKSYMSFATIFGFYDDNLKNMGIPKNNVLLNIEKLKTRPESSIKSNILKGMPVKMRFKQKAGTKQQIKYGGNPTLEAQSHIASINKMLSNSSLNPMVRIELTKAKDELIKQLNPSRASSTSALSTTSGTSSSSSTSSSSLFNINRNFVSSSSIPQDKTYPFKLNIKRQTTIVNILKKDGTSENKQEKMGWFDIWKRHFLENFNVITKLINGYISYDFNKQDKIQPDVYFKFYEDQIIKQFVKAYTASGMLDMLYRTFYSYMIQKTNRLNFNTQKDLLFKDKIQYICLAAQFSYTYLLLVNKSFNINLVDEMFQKRLQISSNYIITIFKKYDISTNDTYDEIKVNLDELKALITQFNMAYATLQDKKSPIDLALNILTKSETNTPIDLTNPEFTDSINQIIISNSSVKTDYNSDIHDMDIELNSKLNEIKQTDNEDLIAYFGRIQDYKKNIIDVKLKEAGVNDTIKYKYYTILRKIDNIYIDTILTQIFGQKTYKDSIPDLVNIQPKESLTVYNQRSTNYLQSIVKLEKYYKDQLTNSDIQSILVNINKLIKNIVDLINFRIDWYQTQNKIIIQKIQIIRIGLLNSININITDAELQQIVNSQIDVDNSEGLARIDDAKYIQTIEQPSKLPSELADFVRKVIKQINDEVEINLSSISNSIKSIIKTDPTLTSIFKTAIQSTELLNTDIDVRANFSTLFNSIIDKYNKLADKDNYQLLEEYFAIFNNLYTIVKDKIRPGYDNFMKIIEDEITKVKKSTQPQTGGKLKKTIKKNKKNTHHRKTYKKSNKK